MSAGACHVACDLGADSGRVMLGRLRGEPGEERLELEEMHRFPNGPVRLGGSLRWDLPRIFEELKIGLRKVAATGAAPQSLSVDSWGVDYVLQSAEEPLLSLPFHYRDERTQETFDAARKELGEPAIFARTGVQFLVFNTLYQLLADRRSRPHLLALSERFLCIADALHYFFSGTPGVERSMASTTQLYNPVTRDWAWELIDAAKLPRRIFPPLVDSGTTLGQLSPRVAEECGLPESVQIIATCSHDTAAAVAAVPAEEGEDWAYLSSGTWSLIGVELKEPLINEAVRARNFTNEIGHGHSVRFLKNICGLWILQECRRAWESEGLSLTYDELDRQAEAAGPARCFFDPNDPRFMAAGKMPGRIAAYAKETGQPVPQTPGQFARVICESLARSYRQMLDQIEELTGRTIRRLHIVGGGSRSVFLNQCAADATGREVLAGPVEATAIGNVLLQGGGSLLEMRHIVRNSFPITTYRGKYEV